MDWFEIAWILSPLVLFPVLMHYKKENRTKSDLLKRLYLHGRVSASDMQRVHVEIPQQTPVPDLIAVTQQQERPSEKDAPQTQEPAVQQQPVQENEAENRRLLHKPVFSDEPEHGLTDNQPEPAAQTAVPQNEKPAAPMAELPAKPEGPPQKESEQKPVLVPKAPASQAGSVTEQEEDALRRVQQFREAVHSGSEEAEKKSLLTRISTISVMLAVGVVLIVAAGILFVRSSWSQMTDGGKLVTLAMGSVLFFGTAALARRVFRLERTSMAFFTLGAVFLPISFWAAGVFHLLGDRLSGAGNCWLITLSALMFTLICLIAVRIYQKSGWAIGLLTGGTVTALYLTAALTQNGIREIILLTAALLAAGMAFAAEPVRRKSSGLISRTFAPFAVCYTTAAAFSMLTGLASKDYKALCGIAALICAAAFFAPAVTRILRQGTGPLTGMLSLLGFGLLLSPLRSVRISGGAVLLPSGSYYVTVSIAAAVCFLLLLLSGRLPVHVRGGFEKTAFVLLGMSAAAELYAFSGRITLPALVAELLLTLILAAGAVFRKSRYLKAMSAAQALLLSISAGCFAGNRLLSAVQAVLLSAVLLLCFSALFRFAKRLRTQFSDYLLGISAMLAGHAALGTDAFLTWVSGAAIGVLCARILLTAYSAMQSEGELKRELAAGQSFLLSIQIGFFAADRTLTDAQAFLLSSAILLGFFAAFHYVKKLRTPFSDLMLGVSALFGGPLAVGADGFRTWVTAGSIGLLAVLFLITVHSALTSETPYPRLFAAMQACLLSLSVGYYAAPHVILLQEGALLAAGLLTAFFLLFHAVKKLRSGLSKTLLPAAAFVCADAALAMSRLRIETGCIAAAFSAVLLVLLYALAVAGDRKGIPELVLAVLFPAGLFALMLSMRSALDMHAPAWQSDLILLCWAAVSCGAAIFTERTTKKRFHAVRRTLFRLTAVPPLVCAFLMQTCFETDLGYLNQLICILFAGWLWIGLAGHGFKLRSAAAFTACTMLLCLTTGIAVSEKVFSGKTPFTVNMIASVWILLFAGAALLIRRNMLIFVGRDAVTPVMRVLTPASTLLFSVMLNRVRPAEALVPVLFSRDNPAEWHPVFWLWTAAFCAMCWLLTEKKQLLLPSVSTGAMFLTLEALRRHLGAGNGVFVLLLFGCAGLILLLSYLGIVLRGSGDSFAVNPRSYVMTAAGGLVPVWMLWASLNLTRVRYSHEQLRWLWFFIPMLLAGYVLHFTFGNHSADRNRALKTAAAGLFTAALWLQPLINVRGGYWEGKLHLIPLLLFGAAIRFLYGAKAGSGFLFAVSVYGMIRLAVSAVLREQTADLLTVFFAALLIFVISFWLKQKKWFLLGGVSLVGIALYLRMKLFPGMQWWVWLLLAGILLIVIAAVNEMLKQRGETLKSRAGRFWEDWEW